MFYKNPNNRDRHRDSANDKPRHSPRNPQSMVSHYLDVAKVAVYDYERESALQHADHWGRVLRGMS